MPRTHRRWRPHDSPNRLLVSFARVMEYGHPARPQPPNSLLREGATVASRRWLNLLRLIPRPAARSKKRHPPGSSRVAAPLWGSANKATIRLIVVSFRPDAASVKWRRRFAQGSLSRLVSHNKEGDGARLARRGHVAIPRGSRRPPLPWVTPNKSLEIGPVNR